MSIAHSKPLHERVALALDGAGDLTGPALIRHIETAHGDDPALIAEVRSLLSLPADASVPVLDKGGPAAAHELARKLHERLLTSELFTRGGTPTSQMAAPVPGPMPTTIGRYQVVGVLGHGGMGVVYEAIQPSPRRRVAVKMLGEGLPSRAALARFKQEAEVLGRLKHPGIAQVFEAATEPMGGSPYFVMEFVDGLPLTGYADKNRLGLLERVELLARVCDAVQHAHQAGVIHRDLKPSNIFVEPGEDACGQPKVLDFGVAKLSRGPETNSTIAMDTGRIIGTLGYMPPEALDASEHAPGADTRGDVYALGVLLYELLTGSLPISLKGASLTDAARRIRESEPPALTALPAGPGAELRGDLDLVCRKAMDKDPGRRYASAGEFGAELRRIQRHEPVLARPPSTWYSLRKFIRRRRGVSALAASAGVLVVAASVVTAVQYVRAERALAQEAEARAAAQRKQIEAERGQYRLALSAADSALRSGNAVQARRSLEQAPEHLRGWEWRYLAHSLNPGRVLALPAPVSTVVAVPQWRRVLAQATGDDRRTFVWDAARDAVVATLPLTRAVGSSDGQVIAGIDASGALVGVDAKSLGERWRVPTPASEMWMVAKAIRLGEEGQGVAASGEGGSGGGRSAGWGSGEVGREAKAGLVSGPHLAVQSATEVAMVNAATGAVAWRYHSPRRLTNLLTLETAASQGLPPLVVVHLDRGAEASDVLCLDGLTGTPIAVDLAGTASAVPSIENGGASFAYGVSLRQPLASGMAPPDGLFTSTAVAGDQSAFVLGDTRGTIHVYRVRRAGEQGVGGEGAVPIVEPARTILAGDGTIHSLAIVTGVGIFAADRAGRVTQFPLEQPPTPYAVGSDGHSIRGPASPDGTRMLTVDWGSVSCYDTLLGLPLWRRNTGPNHTSAVAWSPDGSKVVWFGGGGSTRSPAEMYVIDARSGAQLLARSFSPVQVDPVHGMTPAAWTSRITSAAFDPRGDRLLLSEHTGAITVLSAADWTVLGAPAVSADEAPAERGGGLISFSPDGARLAHLYDGDANRRGDGTDPPIGQRAVGMAHEIAIRNGRGLERAASLRPRKRPMSMAWFPDSRRLAIGHSEGEVSVWDAARGTMLWSVSLGTPDDVLSLRVSPDGTRIAAGGAGPAVHILDAGSLAIEPASGVASGGTKQGGLLASLSLLTGFPSVVGFEGGHSLVLAGTASLLVRLEAGDEREPGQGHGGLRWTAAARAAWPAALPLPETPAEARLMVLQASELVHRIGRSAGNTQRRARAALADATVPPTVAALAAHWITTLGPQLNWVNSDNVDRLRRVSDDRESMRLAAEAAEEIVNMKPHSASLRLNLATTLRNAGEPAAALPHAMEAIRLYVARGADDDPGRYTLTARIALEAGRAELAPALLERAAALLAEGESRGGSVEQARKDLAELRAMLEAKGATGR